MLSHFDRIPERDRQNCYINISVPTRDNTLFSVLAVLLRDTFQTSSSLLLGCLFQLQIVHHDVLVPAAATFPTHRTA